VIPFLSLFLFLASASASDGVHLDDDGDADNHFSQTTRREARNDDEV
jgi:hypothetical protein